MRTPVRRNTAHREKIALEARPISLVVGAIMPETRGEYVKRVRFSYPRETQIGGGWRELSLYNIKKSEKREREWNALEEATGEASISGALDVATRHYLRMAGGNEVEPQGRLVELLQLAEEQRSVTAAGIADVLDVDELPIEHESKWTVRER